MLSSAISAEYLIIVYFSFGAIAFSRINNQLTRFERDLISFNREFLFYFIFDWEALNGGWCCVEISGDNLFSPIDKPDKFNSAGMDSVCVCD